MPNRATIVHGIKHGVPLTLDDSPLPGVNVPNHPLLYFDLERVKESIAKEESLGRYVRVPPSTDPSVLNLSAMGVAPRFESFESRRAFESHIHQFKPCLKHAAADDFRGGPVPAGPGLASLDGLKGKVKWRVIHDLTHPDGVNANAFVTSPHFELPTAVQFARRLSQGAWLWKGDVDSAFRVMAVRQRDWPLLAFFVDGVLYVDTRLPFGHALSPYYFCNFVGRPVLYVAARRGATLLGALSAYIDDFFGGCDSYDDAIEQMRIWLHVCADLGVPVSQSKTFLPTRVLEILGFIINTEDMTISVSSERIQDILDEMAYVSGQRSVRKKDLERLAGKMTFICSVVAGGRTFMRELLDTLRALKGKNHWAHLSHGFRHDLQWWRLFAHTWNGVEAIPPPVSVPWHFLTSDASGEQGVGVFALGAGLHVPLPLALHDADDAELIIAETELIAAVLLVALVAPLLAGEHILLGVDNTNAISWIDRGTSRRPRAMRALRVLWRLQAEHRIHVSVRYVTSERNTLADSASRLDPARFFDASASWHHSHDSSLSSLPATTRLGASHLHVAAYGAAGGAAGTLVQLLVEGHPSGVWDPEGQVAGVLREVSTHSQRFVAQQPDRLHHVAGHGGQEQRQSAGLLHDPSLRGLLGESHVVHVPGSAEPCTTPGGAAVPARSGSEAGQGRQEGRAVPARPLARHHPLGAELSRGRERSDGGHGGPVCVLGLSPYRQPDPQGGRVQERPADRRRCPLGERCRNPNGARLQDHSLCGTDPPSAAARTGGPALVPETSIHPLDLVAATPIVPDAIVRAVRDDRRHAVAFTVPGSRQPRGAPLAQAHWPLLSARLRAAGLHSGRAHLADHAPRRLADSGSGHVLRGGLSDAQPRGSAFREPSHVTGGVSLH